MDMEDDYTDGDDEMHSDYEGTESPATRVPLVLARRRELFAQRRQESILRRQRAKAERELRKSLLGQPINVHVSIKTSATDDQAFGTAQGLLKHLLYMRQMVPDLYDQFRDATLHSPQEEQGEEGRQARRQRQTAGARRALKMVQAVEAQLQAIKWLMTAHAQVDCIVFTLGGTPFNPKEAYILRFQVDDAHASPPSANANGKGDNLGVFRAVARSLMTQQLEQWEAPPPRGKLFVMARVANVRSSVAWEQGGWVPKMCFAPRFGRCRPVVVNVGTGSPESGAGGVAGWSAAGPVPDDSAWLQCGSTGVRGMPMVQDGN